MGYDLDLALLTRASLFLFLAATHAGKSPSPLALRQSRTKAVRPSQLS